MNPISINVAVKIDLTDELYGFLLDLARPSIGDIPERVRPVPIAVPIPEPEQAPTPQPEPEPEPAPEEAPVQYTAADVRLAMANTRTRIEGDDWADSGSEGRAKWHSQLTKWFREQSALIANTDKPSQLPDHATRKAFIDLCANLQVIDGTLQLQPPF